MTCSTCHGDGYIIGHWMPELCPACSGAREVQPTKMDKDMPGCLLTTAIFAVCIVGAVMWPVVQFLWAVL